MNKTIEVVPYDPNWARIYDQEAAIIKQALQSNCIDIHHIGSTAVPDLAATPKIEIIAIVESGDLSITQLETIGFSYTGEWNIPFQFAFTKNGQHDINLHVFEKGHPEIELNLLFRDHLRSNPESLREYADMKERLIADEASFQQQGSMFSNYKLEKDRFIRQILKNTGYNRHRFLRVTHKQEWADYHRIRKTVIFYPCSSVYEATPPSITENNVFHFILCHGVEARTIAHVEFLNESEAALMSFATDPEFQSQGYGTAMILFLEKWLKKQNIKLLKMHSRPTSLAFYKKRGFVEMPFDDSWWQNDYRLLGKALDLS